MFGNYEVINFIPQHHTSPVTHPLPRGRQKRSPQGRFSERERKAFRRTWAPGRAHQLLRISEHIHTAFQNKQHTVATFLDISQAFARRITCEKVILLNHVSLIQVIK